MVCLLHLEGTTSAQRRDGDSNPEGVAALPLFESGSLPFGHPSGSNGRTNPGSAQGLTDKRHSGSGFLRCGYGDGAAADVSK